jgi:hypothetical protein
MDADADDEGLREFLGLGDVGDGDGAGYGRYLAFLDPSFSGMNDNVFVEKRLKRF